MQSAGVPASAVTFANRDELRVGYTDAEMAALYSASDVVWMATYGEGFGVPGIEAQACGTRVIASDWAATADLVEALQKAYKADRGTSAVARSFALQFDVETVWEGSWLPFLREYLSKA